MKLMQSLMLFFILAFSSAAFSAAAADSDIIPKPDENGLRFLSEISEYNEDSEKFIKEDLANAINQKELEIIQRYSAKIQANLYAAYEAHKLKELNNKQAFDVGLIVNAIAHFASWSVVNPVKKVPVAWSHVQAKSLNTAAVVATDGAFIEASLTAGSTARDTLAAAIPFDVIEKIEIKNQLLKPAETYLYSVSLALQYIADHPEWIGEIVKQSILAVKKNPPAGGWSDFEIKASGIEIFIDSFKGEDAKMQAAAAYINLFYPMESLERKFNSHKTSCETPLTAEDAEHQIMAIKLTEAAKN